MVLRRVGGSNSDNQYTISEIKVYEVTNLLHYGAQILAAPDESVASLSADNLIENLRTRSARYDMAPVTDNVGSIATF